MEADRSRYETRARMPCQEERDVEDGARSVDDGGCMSGTSLRLVEGFCR